MKENLCIPCCRSLDGKPRDDHAWKIFMKSSALENMKKHINIMHPELISDEPSVQQELSKKQAKYNSVLSISVVKFMKPSL